MSESASVREAGGSASAPVLSAEPETAGKAVSAPSAVAPVENTTESSPEAPYVYYWDRPDGDDVSTQEALRDGAYWAGEQIVGGLEFIGEVAANVLGITQSRFQLEIDIAQREQERLEHQMLVERQRRYLQEEARRKARQDPKPSAAAEPESTENKDSEDVTV